MNWYLSKLVFQIICGEGNHTAQFDEQLRLIRAEDETEAYSRALALGLKEQDEFFDSQQKIVQWKFINLAELYKLSALLDGAELHSKIQEIDHPELYIELTNHKAAHIRQNSTRKMLGII
jgi:hypothetical protein